MTAPIVINGNYSTDPDVDPSENQKLEYEWFCKRKTNKEQIDFQSDTMIVDYPPKSLADTSSFKGCFGTGPGKLKEKGDFLSISLL